MPQIPESTSSIPVFEEDAYVQKRSVVTGRVQVRTVTDHVPELVQEGLYTESVHISRVPVDREVDVPPEIRTEGDVLIVPVVEEVLIVEKRLVLKEEIHVRRVVSQEQTEVPINLRKQRALIQRSES